MLVILVLIYLTGLLSKPEVAEAFSDPAQAGQSGPNSAQEANLTDPIPGPGTEPVNLQTQPDCSLPSRYPQTIRRWCPLIEIAARKTGLEPRLVAAVMLQESGGDPDAYSHSGAVGLMQVMPRDGLAASFQCNGKPCFSARPAMTELYDPEFNISYGTRMLAGLVQRHGNERDALKYYGPMDVGYGYADKVLSIFNNYQ
jgi:hypothetical protein